MASKPSSVSCKWWDRRRPSGSPAYISLILKGWRCAVLPAAPLPKPFWTLSPELDQMGLPRAHPGMAPVPQAASLPDGVRHTPGLALLASVPFSLGRCFHHWLCCSPGRGASCLVDTRPQAPVDSPAISLGSARSRV